MGIKDMAVWLANIDGNGATDEAFAEFFVLYNKIKKTEDPNVDLTKDDMTNADVAQIVKDIENPLNEIIFSEEVDISAWWKQKGWWEHDFR